MNAHKMIALAALCVAAATSLSYADSIPTAANLVHRWSFNGNFEDTGSGVHQTATIQPSGSTLVTCSSTALQVAGDAANWHTGYLNLGANLLPTDSDGVTIEIFATPKALYQWGRIFAYGTSASASFDFTWTEAADVNRDLIILPNGYNIFNTMQPYTLNEMHHISVVLEKDGNGGTWVRWARRDTGTGEIESQCDLSTTALNPGNYSKKTDNPLGMSRLNNWTLANFTNPQFLLGASFSGTSDIPADYHEVRIWNIALTDGQLSANAKAGPDDIPYSSNVQYDSLAAYVSTEDGKGRYINTGIIGRSGTKVEAKFRQTGSTSTWPVFIGVDGTAGNTRFHPVGFNGWYQLVFQYRGVSNHIIYNPGDYGHDLVVVSDYASDGAAHVVVTNAVTGEEVASVSKTDMGDPLDTGRPMYLFGCNGNNWLSDFFFGRCYYVKIWQTNSNGEYELVRSYVPCIKDDVPGLYDEVSNTIFYPVGMPFEYGIVGTAETATWNGKNSNPVTPGNWLCYDTTSTLIENAVPSSETTVTIDSVSPVPEISTGMSLHWGSLFLGNAAAGRVNQTGGTLTVTTRGAIGASAGVSGTYAIGGGTFTAGGLFEIGQNGTGTLSVSNGASVALGSVNLGTNSGSGGRLEIAGDGTSVALTSWMAIADQPGSVGEVVQTGGSYSSAEVSVGQRGQGTYTQSGGTMNLSSAMYVGRWGGTGTYTLSGDGSARLTSFQIGVNAGSTGTVMFENGTLNATSGDWYVGQNGTGTFTQNGGVLTTGGTIIVGGGTSGVGTYTLNDGALNETWWIQLGSQGTGTFVQNGGNVVLAGGTSGGKPHSWLCLASQDTGDATFVLSNGTFSATAGIQFGEGTHGGKGRFEMNGGVVTVPTIKYAHGTATVLLNGGTLRAAADNAAFLDGLGTVTVGNITVDTTENGYALGVSKTTLSVTPGVTPAITLTGSGLLDLSGAGLELTVKPSVSSLVIAQVAEGSHGTFTGVPTLVDSHYTRGCRVKMSADGKCIRLVRSGLVIIVK